MKDINMKELRPLGRTGIMVTPSQVALNWLIQYNGATKEIHVKENCGAMSFSLSDEDMIRLDKVSSIFK